MTMSQEECLAGVLKKSHGSLDLNRRFIAERLTIPCNCLDGKESSDFSSVCGLNTFPSLDHTISRDLDMEQIGRLDKNVPEMSEASLDLIRQ